MKRTAFSPHGDVYIQYLKAERKHNMSVQHYHDLYEIYFQLEGKRYLFYDNTCYTLERGDIAVIKPFEIHYAESRESEFYARYVINFRADALSLILTPEESYNLFELLQPCIAHLTEEQTHELYGYFSRADMFSKETGFLSQKLLYSSVIQLLSYVIKCTQTKQVSVGKRVPSQIALATEYINLHYKESLNLDTICSAVFVSKYHFCHNFKNVTGATVMEYLNNIRLAKVHSLLLNTDYTIGEIAQETGFSSAANLGRAFKKVYGVSPREFKNSQITK